MAGLEWGGTADDIVASWWRPFICILAGITLCICTLFFSEVRLAGMGMLVTLIGGAGVLRTIDKQTTADVSKAQMVSPTPPEKPIAAAAKVGG